MSKKAVNYRLTEHAIELLKVMAEKKGISQAAVLELLIREAAAKPS